MIPLAESPETLTETPYRMAKMASRLGRCLETQVHYISGERRGSARWDFSASRCHLLDGKLTTGCLTPLAQSSGSVAAATLGTPLPENEFLRQIQRRGSTFRTTVLIRGRSRYRQSSAEAKTSRTPPAVLRPRHRADSCFVCTTQLSRTADPAVRGSSRSRRNRPATRAANRRPQLRGRTESRSVAPSETKATAPNTASSESR